MHITFYLSFIGSLITPWPSINPTNSLAEFLHLTLTCSKKKIITFFLYLWCVVPYNLFGLLYYELPFDLLKFMFSSIFLTDPHKLHNLKDFFLPQLAVLTVLYSYAAFFVWSFKAWFLRFLWIHNVQLLWDFNSVCKHGICKFLFFWLLLLNSTLTRFLIFMYFLFLKLQFWLFAPVGMLILSALWSFLKWSFILKQVLCIV